MELLGGATRQPDQLRLVKNVLLCTKDKLVEVRELRARIERTMRETQAACHWLAALQSPSAGQVRRLNLLRRRIPLCQVQTWALELKISVLEGDIAQCFFRGTEIETLQHLAPSLSADTCYKILEACAWNGARASAVAIKTEAQLQEQRMSLPLASGPLLSLLVVVAAIGTALYLR